MRLRYVGLLFYATELFSAVTGIVFILLVTRSLTVSEFGEWQIFSLVVGYTTFLYDAFPFWAARFRARGFKESIITGLAVNVLLALIIDIILILFLDIISKSLLITNHLLIIVALFTFTAHVHRVLYQGVYVTQTEKVAISIIIFELSKVLLCFILTTVMELRIYGVVFSVLAATIIQIIYLSLFELKDLRQKPSFTLIKKWMRTIWLSVYQYVGGLLLLLDIPILILYTGLKEVAAFYNIGMPFASVILYARLLAAGLYPKLLTTGSNEDVEETLRLSMFLAIPSTVAILILSPYLLYILNPEYVSAYNVLRIMALDNLIIVLIDILVSTMLGVEKTDTESVRFKDIIKSRLFLTSSIPYLRASILLSSLGALVMFYKGLNIISLSEYTRSFNLIASLILLTILSQRAKNAINFKFPTKNLLNYIIASAAMALLVTQFQPLKIRDLALTVVIGAGVYFSVLYMLDPWFRGLARRVYEELAHKVKPISGGLIRNCS